MNFRSGPNNRNPLDINARAINPALNKRIAPQPMIGHRQIVNRQTIQPFPRSVPATPQVRPATSRIQAQPEKPNLPRNTAVNSLQRPNRTGRVSSQVQPKAAGSNRAAPPQAPPVYRPRTTPRILQPKAAEAISPSLKRPIAPPIYKPNVKTPIQAKSSIKISDLHLGRAKTAAVKPAVSGAVGVRTTGVNKQNRGSVIQGLIYYDNKTSQYAKNQERSGWQKHAEDSIREEYNARFVQSLTVINYNTLKFARAHIGSFDNIQIQIVKYLNGDITETAFNDFISNFIDLLSKSSDEYANIMVSVKLLKQSISSGFPAPTIVNDANTLLSRLNNLSKNLRAADKYLNSYLQERLDLVFIQKPSGEFSLNPQGKKLLSMGSDTWGEVPRTPDHGQRVVTSEGAVPIGSMSPISKPMIESYPFTQIKIKSKNVRSRLYGPSAISNFEKMPQSSSLSTTTSSSQTVTVPPPVFTASAPVITPPPRYIPHTNPLVGIRHDGSEIHSVFDSYTQASTYLHVMGSTILNDLGPLAPPRYEIIKKVGVRLNGAEIYLDHDSHTNSAVYLEVTGSQITKVLGASMPPRYEIIKKVGTRLNGTEIYYNHDTHTNSQVYVEVNGSTVTRVLGPAEPSRYETVSKIGTRLDGSSVFYVHDMSTNGRAYVRVKGSQIVEEFGATEPNRYELIQTIRTYMDGTEEIQLHDSYRNAKVSALAKNSKIIHIF